MATAGGVSAVYLTENLGVQVNNTLPIPVTVTNAAGGVQDVNIANTNPILVTIQGRLTPILISLVAAMPLNAFKVITTDAQGNAIYADAANAAHANKVVGISATASNTGDTISVQESGLLVNTGWSWAPGQLLFVGLGGDITTAQVGVFSEAVGYAVTATSISVRIGRAILR